MEVWSGYVPTVFRINGIRKHTRVYILVARAFVPNPESKPYVNHINGIKHDNWAVNLESKENAECRVFPNRGRESGIIQIWNSICLAGNMFKIAENSILECCSEKRNTASGWCWMYYEDYIQDPNEEWKKIEYKLRKFKVSTLGRIQLTNSAITQGSLYEGYFRFNQYYIHRLVALVFCSKEEGKDCVNYIDGNRTNNKASNLEWCTQKENTQHSIFDDGSFREFPSLAEAQCITGIKSQNIRLVRRGLQAHAGGYRWENLEFKFPSLAEAQCITGIKSQNIRLVRRGLQAHAGGYRWENLEFS
ncbi:hypothetical protein Glove_184g104 [Diversispora epigaea]|uniref:HNH nuclease domain-containing protein n=1 Tax=Diversispora epigaea TaxID=1348612 RepID=A0A397IMR0_9GLOM|nr:hypothetical protein Glove_184g104 [Diversispora epigaea]